VRLVLDVTTVSAVRTITGPREPDPVEVALIAVRSGADAIGINIKGERSHVRDRDCHLLREVVKAPITIKIPTSNELVRMAMQIKPASVILLPERREDLPLEEGLDVILNQAQVKRAYTLLRESGIDVMAFINPTIDQVRACHKLDVQGVELNALKFAESGREEDLEAIRESARLAHKLHLRTATGRGLTATSLSRIAGIQELDEVHVGRMFVARAIVEGVGHAVRSIRVIIDRNGGHDQ